MTTPARRCGPALAYHRAWTSGDLDGAMAHVADGFVCRAPDGEITGKDAYHGYLRDFLQIMTGLTDVAAFGDQEQALLFYYDRLSFAPPQDQ